MRKVLLAGAGSISQVHAEALRHTPGVKLQGVVDPNQSAARALAAQWNIPRVFSNGVDALTSGEIDCVHVLTPPDLHMQSALPYLNAGKPVLLEKPLAVSSEACETLMTAADRHGVVLGVNQNFVHHPAFVRLRRAIDARQLGKPRFVQCLYNVPLRQMATRQFGHWMFAQPGNILLEQAVHPLSQIVAIAGRVEETRALAGPVQDISPGVPFYDSISMVMRCARLPADLRIAVGQEFPFWQVSVVCDDGVGVADILNNRFFTYERTLWLEFFDALVSGTRTGKAIIRDSRRNALDYILATARLKRRSDSFFQSILGSVQAFHAALDAGRPPELDAAFGAHLVSVCETTAQDTLTASCAPAKLRMDGPYDVAVLGGTGFIGVSVVRRLLDAGFRVGVMARNTRNLAPLFTDSRVTVIRGDVKRETDVVRAITPARFVVNLAHGGGGRTFAEIRAAMVGSAEVVAKSCLAAKTERLIHVGSIAGLYLGPQDQPVTGATPPDPRLDKRADYARAKAETDILLMTMHAREGLPVCILRPGIVVGENGVIAHTGCGVYNTDQHCIGWNDGRNPLPFVLVEDVAAAIHAALEAPSVVGKTYNLVGDVRLSARDYIAELGAALQRPLAFHPKSTTVLWLQEVGKWIVKVAGGRKVDRPRRRDFLSRAMTAAFDCTDAKRDLGWSPVADRGRFIDRAIKVHAES